MTQYYSYNIGLTTGQKDKLLDAYKKRGNDQLTGNYKVLLTKTQINRIKKSLNENRGVDLTFSQTQMRKQIGGFLRPIIRSILPIVKGPAMKLASNLASGAVSGLGSWETKKILGDGLFNVPQNKIDQLIKHKNLLTKSQKEQIINALQTRGSLVIQLTPQQRGGFLGTLLASVGVPNAISGRGLQLKGIVEMRKKKRKRSSIREEAKEGERTSNREEAEERKGFDPWEEQSVQWDPNHWGYPMNKPLSNFDLV